MSKKKNVCLMQKFDVKKESKVKEFDLLFFILSVICNFVKCLLFSWFQRFSLCMYWLCEHVSISLINLQ